MGLVGSLDDLGLGDILQIISLSRKSGVLNLRSSKGEGVIVFSDGLICRSFVKGGAVSLGELLASSGMLAQDEYQIALKEAASTGTAIETLLARNYQIPEEKIETLRRGNVEAAVLEIFQWADGDFSFEVEEVDVAQDPALALSKGINAQFLAMEGSRLSDEATVSRHASSSPEEFAAAPQEEVAPVAAAPKADAVVDDPFSFAELGEEVRAETAPASSPAPAPVAAPPVAATAPAAASPESFLTLDPEPAPIEFEMPLAMAELEATPEEEAVVNVVSVQEPEFADVGTLPEDALSTEVVAEMVPEEVIAPTPEPVNPLPSMGVASSASVDSSESPAKVAPPAALPSVAIVVDGDRGVAEWAKRSLSDRIRTIHLFEKLDPAMQRTRQYLKRGELPLIILSCEFKDIQSFVKRLHKMAPKIRVIGLVNGATSNAIKEAVEATLQKPSVSEVEDSSASAKCAGLGKALMRSLVG